MNEDRQEMTLQEQKHTVAVDSMDEVIRLFGVFDENLKVIEEETGAVIKAGADCIDITGPEEAAALAETVLDKLLGRSARGKYRQEPHKVRHRPRKGGQRGSHTGADRRRGGLYK